jgi:hypothetical protein
MLSSYAALAVLGGAVLAVSWYAVSGEARWQDQRTGVDTAVLGVLLAYGAGALLLVAGRRAVGLRRAALLGDRPAALVPVTSAVAPVPVPEGGFGGVLDVLVGADGLRRFHRADCTMAHGRGWTAASRPEHQRDGRTPCGVCRP